MNRPRSILGAILLSGCVSFSHADKVQVWGSAANGAAYGLTSTVVGLGATGVYYILSRDAGPSEPVDGGVHAP